MLNRNEIFEKAYDECMTEMYAKSQPPADYHQLIEDVKSGKIDKEERIYERHYLSYDEFNYILDKYLGAYGFRQKWVEYIEILEKYLIEGGHKDKYVPEKIDENGFKHPGYRSYEDVPPLKEQFVEMMEKFDMSVAAKNIAIELYDKVMETIKNCKEYYQFDREESEFSIAISLGASPTSSAKNVKEWWKTNKGIDIKIEERNPKLFWYYDNGYTDEELAWEFEDYGPNWKEKLYQEWQDEIRRKKEENKRKLEELKKEIENAD